MPLIQVKLIEKVLSPSQKAELITKLTDFILSVEGENFRPVTWLTIQEARSGELRRHPMSTEAVQAVLARKR
ncbi:MAG TPA: tautomerase family protein [Edaphobacter sp.]|jgi:4-oxalocrotonate tautomerase|nr:tautomerase family protein [Edaphobacter sp.]